MPSMSYYHMLCKGNLRLLHGIAKNEHFGKFLFLKSVFSIAAKYFTISGLAVFARLSCLDVDREEICTSDPSEFCWEQE